MDFIFTVFYLENIKMYLLSVNIFNFVLLEQQALIIEGKTSTFMALLICQNVNARYISDC